MLGVPPVLSTADIQVPIIGCDDLFTVFDSKKWTAHIGSHDAWDRVLSMAANSVDYVQDVTGFGLQTILGTTWLSILKTQRSAHCVSKLGTSHSASQNNDIKASCLPLLMRTYGGSLNSGNGNSLILWHYIGLCLTTNLSAIEDAAGRNGPEAAKAALGSLKTWADTPAARRACLHAISALTASSRQWLSEGVMLHTEMALFTAALVLGFYTVTAPRFEATDHNPSYDLFEDVDWTEVGDAGLLVQHDSSHPQPEISTSPVRRPELQIAAAAAASSSCSSSSSHSGPSTTCAATIFIQNGGPVSFRGAEYHNSYGSARRTFMNYAAHLEEIGRWNVEEYCKVLYIISDTLLTSDATSIPA
jgi:hypothetical protein